MGRVSVARFGLGKKARVSTALCLLQRRHASATQEESQSSFVTVQGALYCWKRDIPYDLKAAPVTCIFGIHY